MFNKKLNQLVIYSFLLDPKHPNVLWDEKLGAWTETAPGTVYSRCSIHSKEWLHHLFCNGWMQVEKKVMKRAGVLWKELEQQWASGWSYLSFVNRWGIGTQREVPGKEIMLLIFSQKGNIWEVIALGMGRRKRLTIGRRVNIQECCCGLPCSIAFRSLSWGWDPDPWCVGPG